MQCGQNHALNVVFLPDARCQLTAYPVGRRFRPENKLNTLMADVFESIHTATHNMPLPEVSLIFVEYWYATHQQHSTERMRMFWWRQNYGCCIYIMSSGSAMGISEGYADMRLTGCTACR